MVQITSLSADWVIHNIPFDVWRHIFGIFFQQSSNDTRKSVLLSHVCSTWRSIVTNAPELWTTVNLTIKTSDEQSQASLFSLVLRNSGNMPLRMDLRGMMHETTTLTYPQHVWDFLEETRRAKELSLDFGVINALLATESAAYGTVKTELQPCALLENLTLLNTAYKEPNAIPLLERMWMPAPSLISFAMYGAGVSSTCMKSFQKANFPFHQLSALKIGTAIQVEALLDTLSLTPLLQAASFHGVAWEDDRDDDDRWVYDEGGIVLPALRTLTLQGYGSPRLGCLLSPPLTRLLAFITTPSLTTLDLYADRGWSPESFETFIRKSSPPIEDLGLDICDFSQDDKISCLKMLPSLKSLDLRPRKDTGRSDLSRLGKQFSMAMRDWDSLTESFSVCPILEKLTIDHDAVVDSAQTAFESMVQERKRRSPEGKYFELVIADVHHS
ncbi:hypothetical protein CVT26_011606 [Gymnopilus dilepis]|uniref:Uncharacterized protein n=1 Tax=Gymnopilus dilepis TaxID=231916 RepID=A0A409YQQ5_9AGAR|nr:hypothetical protein CVT26_011606 [Gymnopilus dilepis]